MWLLLCLSASSAWSGQALLKLQGELTQGGVIRAWLPPNSMVKLDGKALMQAPDGSMVFGFGRDAKPLATLSWQYQGQSYSQSLHISQRNYDTQYVNGVPGHTVQTPAARLKRIRKETAQVKAAREQFIDTQAFLDEFIAPIEGRKTGVYGSQRVYNGVPKRPHYGVDYAAPMGTAVVAPADAVITLAHKDMYYSGGTLIMDHGYGLSSTFIHLSELLVAEGDQVQAGQVVAKVGSGGRSTGPHLDWRLNWHQVRLDPEKILGLKGFGTAQETQP